MAVPVNSNTFTYRTDWTDAELDQKPITARRPEMFEKQRPPRRG